MTRLKKLLSLIEGCDILADVGCDHGLLSAMAAKAGLAKRIYAIDISQKSLDKAKIALATYPNTECILSDGFSLLSVLPDTAVIAGMGGREIVKIISPYRIKTLILGAQNQLPFLRQTLNTLGYSINHDEVVEENAKFYDILRATYSGKANIKLDKTQLEWGCFYKVKALALAKKLAWCEQNLLSYKPTALNVEKLKTIQEVKKWQQ